MLETEKLLELYNSYKRNEITLQKLEEITQMKRKGIQTRLNRNGYKCLNGQYTKTGAEKKESKQAQNKHKTDIREEKKIILENNFDDVVQVSYKYYSSVIEKYNILCSHYRFYKKQDILSFLLEKSINEYWTNEMQEQYEKKE